MTRDERKYSRVYWSVNDDPKFDTIRADSARFGTWVRLLMAADATWPNSAHLPRWLKASHLDALVTAGIVDLLPEERFRIHGMDNERGPRAEAGRAGGLASARSRSVERPLNDRSTTYENVGNLYETSRDETRQAEPSAQDDDALSTYWTVMGSYPTGRTKAWIEELVNEFDDRRVGRAIAAESAGPRQGLLSRVRDRLRSESDKAEKKRAAAHVERLAADAAAKRITPEQSETNRRRVAEELAKMVGPVEAR